MFELTVGSVMKHQACALTLLYLVITGSAQPMYGRPHPLYARQQSADDFLLAALLLGIDFSEMPVFQGPGASGPGSRGRAHANRQANSAMRSIGMALGMGPNFGMPTHPFARQQARQDLNALSMLGIIDGPDVPDGPPGGQAAGPGGRRRGRGGQGPRKAPPAGGEGGGAAEGAVEGAPAKTPGKRTQRRRNRPGKRRQPKQ